MLQMYIYIYINSTKLYPRIIRPTDICTENPSVEGGGVWGAVMATSRLFHGQCFCIFNPLVTRHFLISRQYYAVALKNDCWKGRFWKNRERPSRLIRTWFSDKPPDQPHSVSIVITRGPLQWISNKIKLFLVNSYFDADFDEEIFIEGAKQVVSKNVKNKELTQSHCDAILLTMTYAQVLPLLPTKSSKVIDAK